ncbi:MAG TPA: alanine racemase [Gemmatimonadales bacterium]|nr:alanine racemase [Gemmatimonadales bacterium]
MDNSTSSGFQRAWVDIDLRALVRNAGSYQARVGVPLLPMVKADGYGLGAVAVARALLAVAPWGFGVATIEEALELRAAGVEHQILVFSPFQAADLSSYQSGSVRPVIGDLAALRAWTAAGDAPFHLEIDTGMSRTGLRWTDSAALAQAGQQLRDSAGWEGAFTHFHSAGSDSESTREQWQRFQAAVESLGRRPALLHAANSPAAAFGSQYAGDLARPGIHLYGGASPGMETEPVATLRARVVALRRVREGEPVSYDATWRAARDTVVATLGAGYADGVMRSLSNKGVVEVHGTRVPIVGRVTMDYTMVDVGDLPVRIGDVATFHGGIVTLDEAARLGGTVSYELLTSLGKRVPRIYRNNE